MPEKRAMAPEKPDIGMTFGEVPDDSARSQCRQSYSMVAMHCQADRRVSLITLAVLDRAVARFCPSD